MLPTFFPFSIQTWWSDPDLRPTIAFLTLTALLWLGYALFEDLLDR